MRWIAACLLATGCMDAVSVGPNDNVRLDNGVNGDVSCDRGHVQLPEGTSINGSFDASYCVVDIFGSINGSITVTGGILHVIDVPSVNGELDVSDAYELVVDNSQFNGGADIEGTLHVSVTNSGFNGSVEIDGVKDCTEANNRANGSLVASNCL